MKILRCRENKKVRNNIVSISNKNGITLLSLVITIIIMLILAGIVIYVTIGKNGIIEKSLQAKEETLKQAATEQINLKLTDSQMKSYADNQRMPTLQEVADNFSEDNEIEYVALEKNEKEHLDKIELGDKTAFFTKLKDYPYEFEINGSLQIESIDGIKVAISTHNESTRFSRNKNRCVYL